MNHTFAYPEDQASLSEGATTQHALSSNTRAESFPSHGAPLSFQPIQSPLLSEILVARSSSDSELTSSDKLSALPDSPLSRPRVLSSMERQAIQTSQSAPSLEGFTHHPNTSTPDMSRATASEGAINKGSPFQRVSFESGISRIPPPPSNMSRPGNNVHHPLLRDGGAPPRSPLIESTLSRFRRPSDPPRPSSAMPSSAMRAEAQTSRKGSYESPSASHSRAASPMRIFAWPAFRRRETREEPFVPQNPFQRRNPLRRFSIGSPDRNNDESFDPNCEDALKQCLPRPVTCIPLKASRKFLRSSRDFLMDTLPRQIYLHLLLRLPSLYFSRIARIYQDAELSRPDIERLIEACASQVPNPTSSPIPPGAHYHPQPALPLADEWTIANVSPALIRFKHSWEAFIDSLLREWKTLNLVSALLLSAILSMFQNTMMAQDPVIRTAALLSLTSALMSLFFGCIYIVRFGTMRSMYKATRWAEEARKTTTFIWWNVWVLLAMPAVWLAWSMCFFIAAILSFVWRSDSSTDNTSPAPLSPTAVLGPRIAITALFIVGLIDFVLIVNTLHNYGRTRDVEAEMRLLGTGESTQAHRASADREREDRGRRAGHLSRGRARFAGEGRGRPDGDRPSEGGVLSAVTGLGLTNLDGVLNSSPRSSNELSREKEKDNTVVMVATNS
ncbi:uncharacterized protein HD556DRAFT_1230443 [Suillus plorans]|uniref:Uncharacterized protein n=1 Tax=Suillus plorans TaxID=116603 RepID=A0A9P7DQ42_9AGAM|nr:uncharacterized protein HD556DRAFT_1230443 [Suillus plorans]KAG1800327.1 hypothetical protein HD556DRAFT_1230443 [Suillus plorans]